MLFLIPTGDASTHASTLNSPTFEFDFTSPSLSFTSSSPGSSPSLPCDTQFSCSPADELGKGFIFGDYREIIMTDSYRSRLRRSETPSSSSSGGSQHGSPGHYHQSTSHSSSLSNLSYPPITPAQYSYHSDSHVPSQHGGPSLQPAYGYTFGSPPQFEGPVYGDFLTSSTGPPHGAVPRHSSYPGPAPSTSERASKRQRATTNPGRSATMQPPWAEAHPSSGERHGERAHATSRSSRTSRDSSVSSGYNSPEHSYRSYRDPYGQQLLQPPPSVPSVGPSTIRDPHLYGMRHTRDPSSDDETVEHGPTELPPRRYSGKSQYNPPQKPGKIPGSAMDYLPILEARFERLETAIDKYVDYRGQQALSNSILPGMDASEGSSKEGHYSSSRHSRSSRSSSKR